MQTPTLTFFCELEAAALQALFDDPGLIPQLRRLKAEISLGILDLSPQRAAVVRALNEAGIPLTAWLLLPKDQGYWFNLDNFVHAQQRYQQFLSWTQAHNLHWNRIGLDIEPDFRDLQTISESPVRGLYSLFRKAIRPERGKAGVENYQMLVKQIHEDGYLTESYQFAPILEERRAHSRILQRLTGIADVHTDCEVWMLYSSFVRPNGPAVLWSYAADAQGIGIGVTGGGVDLGDLDQRPPLSWPELRQDLLLARRANVPIYIFSLEGCVEHDTLRLIETLDWSQPLALPEQASRKVSQLRRALQGALFLIAHPVVVIAGIAGVLALVRLIRPKKSNAGR